MDAALVFHEATNHVPGFARDPRLLSFTRDEPAKMPLTFKEYSGLPTIQLELAPPSREAPRAVDVLSQRSFEHGLSTRRRLRASSRSPAGSRESSSEAAGSPFDCGGAAEFPVSFIFGTLVESAQTFERLACPMSAPMLLARLD